MIYRDDLERVYALIEKPENWLQGKFAVDSTGSMCRSSDAQACRWCVEGAFIRVTRDTAQCPTLYEFDNALGVRHSANFNDSHTHAEVLALLKSAIERAPVRD